MQIFKIRNRRFKAERRASPPALPARLKGPEALGQIQTGGAAPGLCPVAVLHGKGDERRFQIVCVHALIAFLITVGYLASAS